MLFDPVEQLMTLGTQYDQVEGLFVTVALVGVVMSVQPIVVLCTNLTAVPGPR